MWLIDYFKNIFCWRKDLESLKREYDSRNEELRLKLTVIENRRAILLNEKIGLEQEISDLKQHIVLPDENEEFWNNKYPKQVITYSGRCLPNQNDRTFETDVRIYFTPYDIQLEEIVNKSWIGIGKLNEGSNDEKALKCLKWVRKNFRYESDKIMTDLSEFWMFPFEALRYKAGDCDDMGILLGNLMLVAKIPYWRIRINAGDVSGSDDGKIGHCYISYCRETDNQFVVLDCCYKYNDKPVSIRKIHSEERDYYGVWFSFNQRFSFGKSDAVNTALLGRHINSRKQ
jgi:hypothetical protein